MDESSSEILVVRERAVGRLRLNRPRAIHALNTAMCAAMDAAVKAWADDPAIAMLMIDHAEGRGFCAGGDVRAAAESGAGDGVEARAFFRTEYRLNHRLFTFPKPSAAFMDGIVMGGGVGLALPCRYRVATEATVFAMPESAIGLFPDVGTGWYLSRLPGRVGAWIAMTGARLNGADCLALGLATHYVAADALDGVKAAIAAQPDRAKAILDAAASDPGPAPMLEHRADIDRLFTGDRLEDILAALEADGGDWAREQRDLLRIRSALTCQVALRLLREGAATSDFATEMAREYALAYRICAMPDFIEGVRAVLVDKDHAPRWPLASAEAVTPALLDTLFAPLPPDAAWSVDD